MHHYATELDLAQEDFQKVTISSALGKEPLATADAIGRKGIDKLLARAQLAKNNMPSKRQRATILNRTARKLLQNSDVFANAISANVGKPIKMAQAEVDFAAEALREAARVLLLTNGEEIIADRNLDNSDKIGVSSYYPHGVALAFSAFTQPLINTVMQIATLFAAGNVVIFKPADHAPLIPLMLQSLMRDQGMPHDCLQIALVWDPENAQYLATNKNINFFNFMGSMEIGLKLNKMIEGQTIMQFGGVTSALVIDELEPNQVEALATCAFEFSGQTAMSVKNIYVSSKHAKKVAKQFADAAKKIKIGNIDEPSTQMSNMITLGQAIKVERSVKNCLDNGGKLYAGGNRNEQFYAPTVILEPNPDCELLNRDIMGPVILVIPVAGIADALNAIHKEHSARVSVYGKQLEAISVAKKINAPCVFVNEVPSYQQPWIGAGSRNFLGIKDGILKSLRPKSMIFDLR